MMVLDFLVADLRSIAFGAYREFRVTLANRRFIVVSATVVLLLCLGAARLAAFAAPQLPNALAVWDRGADGSFVAFAFGLVPILLPVIPIAVGYDALQRDMGNGYIETAMTRRAPRWTVSLGKFFGMLLAMSVSVFILVGASALLTLVTVQTAVSASLVVAVFAGAVLLCGLYLGLVFLLAAILTPGLAGVLTFFAWILFNAIRDTAFVLSGQAILVLKINGPQTFRTAWGDWASFTGLYQGLLAPFVPDAVQFAAKPAWPDLAGIFAFYSVAMGGLPWIAALLTLYAYERSRRPLKA